MIGVGVIGFGYWGPNLVRNFLELPQVQLVAICDTDPLRRDSVRLRYPGINVSSCVGDLLTDRRIDAIAIATPVSTHFELAMAALRADKHVLVEKPLTATSEQALRLIDESERRQRVLMVDHTFLYTPAVRKMRQLVSSGEIGELLYFDSTRVNLGLFRHDANVIWDLAVHDLAIMDHLLPTSPVSVAATGMAHVPGQPENLAYLTFNFDRPLIAHIHVNWLAPVKLRSTVLGGSRKMIVYDDLEPSNKVKIYDKGVTLTGDPQETRRLRISYRAGDMTAPHLETTEALQIELKHFVKCVVEQQNPLSDGRSGLRIVRWLEAAERSMAEQGQPVDLTSVEASV